MQQLQCLQPSFSGSSIYEILMAMKLMQTTREIEMTRNVCCHNEDFRGLIYVL
jgi:hypothetical protein